jgi:hypothetical protein
MNPVTFSLVSNTLGGLIVLHSRLREAGYDLTPQQLRILLIIAAQRGAPMTMSRISELAGCFAPQTCIQLKGLTERGLVSLSQAAEPGHLGRPRKQARLTSTAIHALEGEVMV